MTPDGLNPDALAVVRTMIDAKVDVAGVNVMAMDFGVPSAGKDMLGAVESSLTSTHAQLGALFGTDKSSSQLWGKLGATVMIGQNDVDGERSPSPTRRAIESFASSTRHRPGLDLVAEPRHAVRRHLPGASGRTPTSAAASPRSRWSSPRRSPGCAGPPARRPRS